MSQASEMQSQPQQSQESMPRHVRVGLLLDLYGVLLTDRQREFVRLHYNEDQSFGEIARERGVSRQAVHDAVKHAERGLERYERKMRLLERGIPSVLARIERAPLLSEAEVLDNEADADPETSEAWATEVLDPASPGEDASAKGDSPAATAEVLAPVAEGLSAIKKRILRSGGIIYDADGLLSDVNRLLARVEAMRADGAQRESGGPRDV